MDKEVEYERKYNKIRESIQEVHYLIRFTKGENKIYVYVIKESIK